MTSSQQNSLKDQLNQETAQIHWRELQRFFASGNALSVDPKLDLIEVASAMGEDRAEQVNQWLTQGLLGPVSDHQAQDWYQTDTLVWALVIRPWVLVQYRP